ncbi:hypothetical protein [Caballeronia zhejiangensis]|uniref:hypothetical protein n=1 Tax=Caballeronia zhejiangensis TaxID=871203 RepID=UPI001F51EB4D|nr:hypothetical protein [Caballeronia zhejiangensis]MCI1046951.1 hypothetical protein [Caballeronia zhejiangensis]
MAVNFFAGDSFNYTGFLNLDGVAGGTFGVAGNQPDYSQWSIQCGLFNEGATTQVGFFTVTNLSDPNVPATNGLYQLSAPASATALWPVGKAEFWITARGPDGTTISANPWWYSIKANPLSKLSGQ